MKPNENTQAVTCPPCGENVALVTKRGLSNKEIFFTTPHRPYGALPPQVGKLTTHGFTLIELLVVVLIIGILAAVAVPQYRVAVEKARLTEALMIAKNVKDAQERHYLEHGSYTTQMENLDIDFSSASGNRIDLPSGVKVTSTSSFVYAENKTGTNIVKLRYAHHPTDPNTLECYAKKENSVANQVCKSLGGKYDSDAPSSAIGACTIYIL